MLLMSFSDPAINFVENRDFICHETNCSSSEDVAVVFTSLQQALNDAAEKLGLGQAVQPDGSLDLGTLGLAIVVISSPDFGLAQPTALATFQANPTFQELARRAQFYTDAFRNFVNPVLTVAPPTPATPQVIPQTIPAPATPSAPVVSPRSNALKFGLILGIPLILVVAGVSYAAFSD